MSIFHILYTFHNTLAKRELGTSQSNEQASTLLAFTDTYQDMFEFKVVYKLLLRLRSPNL